MKNILFPTMSIILFISSCQNNDVTKTVKQQHNVIIYDANVINVETGHIKKHAVIVLDENKITLVGDLSLLANHQAPKMLNAKNKYVIPGLWDMHVHFEGKSLIQDNEALFPVYIALGITTVRDSASDLGEEVLEWRSQIAQGKLLGPQIYTAGRKLEGIDSIWKGDLEIGTTAELNKALDLLDSKNVDFVKMTANTLKTDLFIEGIKAAKERGYKVSAHIPQKATVYDIVDAGVSSIEHASYLLRLGIPNEAELIAQVNNGEIKSSQARKQYVNNFDQALANKRYQYLAKKGVAITPTLIGGKQLAYLDEDDHSEDDFKKYLTSEFMSHYEWRIKRMGNLTAEQWKEKKYKYQLIASQIPYLQEAGVLVMAGSDSAALNTLVYPAMALHEELILFQDAGMQPLNILQTATINGAKFMGVKEHTASISVNKEADLVILNSNPLENIKATQDIFAVVNNGELYERKDLDRMLMTAQQKKQELDLRVVNNGELYERKDLDRMLMTAQQKKQELDLRVVNK
ncbi:amidohydrolase family protein [Colwellia piezophila]|uniref:amidohydrolase family protein n=1 Tax=Colwellia piezophila TaxID=211668 RepID=UPI00036CF585|nr:amidohydrolase family protein [Colwellia piezophila]